MSGERKPNPAERYHIQVCNYDEVDIRRMDGGLESAVTAGWIVAGPGFYATTPAGARAAGIAWNGAAWLFRMGLDSGPAVLDAMTAGRKGRPVPADIQARALAAAGGDQGDAGATVPAVTFPIVDGRFAVSVDAAEMSAAIKFVSEAMPMRPVVPVMAHLLMTVTADGTVWLGAHDYDTARTARVTGGAPDGGALMAGTALVTEIGRAHV